MRLRVALIGLLFLGLLCTVFGRAIYLQVVMRDRLRGMAEEQYVRAMDIPAKRGDIYDRRGVPLAQSVEVDSIWVDPSLVPDLRVASRLLARKLHLDFDDVYARLQRGRRFAWVKRRVSEKEAQAVRATELPGLGFTREPQRFYPQRELAGQVLGMVGTDGKGLEGLELAFNDELTGAGAQLAGFRDAKGRKLLTQGDTGSTDQRGAAVTLTLDRHLQYLSEKALAKAVEDARALSGMVVVMDPKSGEILALAHYPRFNPNAPTNNQTFAMRDRAALDTFEPGSTFKAFLIAAALESRAIREEQTFYCEKGRWAIGHNIIHDTHPHEDLNAEGILKLSSNICAAKVGEVLGRDRMMDYYGRFGFGEKTGLALPGEGRGSVPFPKAEVQLATQSFGQGLSATAVQVASAYAALANGGVLMRPYLVSRVVDADGVVVVQNSPTAMRRVVSEATAHTVVRMLESVVTRDGTAPKAHMDSYRVAGKTGTAQKVDPVGHGYSDKRIASFAGMVPAENPRLVALVVIDEPKTDVYGGMVAAPAFKEIAEGAMPYLGVPPSSGEPVTSTPSPTPTLAKKLPTSHPIQVKEEPPAAVMTDGAEDGNVPVPPVEGRVGREAVARLLSVALEPRLLGSGRVVSQTPASGTVVPRGTRVTLEMEMPR